MPADEERRAADVMPKFMTHAEKYGPAMSITDQAEADAYFARCVEHLLTHFRRRVKTRDKAEAIERRNLAYYAGYRDHETRARVERLFKCAHLRDWRRLGRADDAAG